MKVSTLYDIPCKIKNEKISCFVYKVDKVLLNILYPLFVKSVKGIDEESNVIVSLTSYPVRIDTIWLTVMILLHQTEKPKKIILWLAEEQFPNKELGDCDRIHIIEPLGSYRFSQLPCQ